MEETKEQQPTPEELKEKGNSSVKVGKFEEAILHYTHAAKLDPKNYALYSNRSYAFLKIQQYALAMEDAMQTISLNPNWAKGYYRKAEIEYATDHFAEACASYEEALACKPDDDSIRAAIERTKKARMKELTSDEQIPWVGCGVGIVIGVIIVILDYILTPTPTHPLLMAVVTIVIGMIGYFVAKLLRSHLKSQRKAMLQPSTIFDEPAEEEDPSDSPKNGVRTGPRYTKSQARQRFKKGKM